MKFFFLSHLFLAASCTCYAASSNPCGVDDETFANLPFFTGPLITPTAEVVTLGHWDFEPYVYVTSNYGVYDHHWNLHTGGHAITVLSQFPVWVGLTSFMDISFLPQFNSRFKNGLSSTQIGDVQITLDFQLVTATPTNYLPGIKFAITETFPTGPYENLSPSKDGVDIGGGGLYQTEFEIVASRQFAITPCHYLSLRTAFLYNFAPPSHVRGFHSYGGGFGADGKIKIGDQFTWLSSFEYNIGIHWALACDLQFLYSKSSSFSGKIGELSNGQPANIALPAGYQWSLAPAIEYNVNQNIGMIAGAWGSFAGKNSPAFLSGVFALNIYY